MNNRTKHNRKSKTKNEERENMESCVIEFLAEVQTTLNNYT